MELSKTQSMTLLDAIIDITQSDDPTISRRARSALFEIGLISGNEADRDGGVAEAKNLFYGNYPASRHRKKLFATPHDS